MAASRRSLPERRGRLRQGVTSNDVPSTSRTDALSLPARPPCRLSGPQLRQVLERQATLWRAMSPEAQAPVAGQQSLSGRRMAALSNRSRHPEASEELVMWLLEAMFVGDEGATRLYGPRPER
ncbi:MAG: hypothetical protein MUC96_19330 [Myxococcaceae bacterium]|nr:hypothetical protein [Myxococcaceae bacterium]